MARKFDNFTSKIPLGSSEKRDLRTRRNKAIAARYYYHFNIRRMREDDVFHLMSETEFFITTDSIYRILIEENGYLNELINTNASIARLQKEYTAFNFK